jgi:anthranilate phosphoribosyltransferase
MIADELRAALRGTPLSAREITAIFRSLTAPGSDDADRMALLVGLAARPRVPEELVGFAREMRRSARRFPVPPSDGAIDLCGSGGAHVPSFNVSTVASFVVRAAGVPVVKHGNRSRRVCGSSDLLEALALPVTTAPEFARASYRRFGIAFLHAPLYHPAMSVVGPARQRLGIPTLFNRLGPLANPAQLAQQISGAADPEAAGEAATALRALGVERGLTMASDDGCDEFSPARSTTIVRWTGSAVRRGRVEPERYLPTEDRRGSWAALPAKAAAEEAERILAGGGGARRGSVLLTSGAALFVAGRARDLGGGVDLAREALDRGLAERLLEEMRALATRYRGPGED